jgi:hypothetical protein
MFFRWFEHVQTFHPSRRLAVEARTVAPAAEDVSLAAADGVSLNGWFLPAPADGVGRSWVVLLCHGNAGNISHRDELYQALHRLGLTVFAFDYRGYGRSEGRPSETGTYLDAQGAYRWLTQRGVVPERILAFGESLGGAVATELAMRERVGGLVLQSTFTSLPDLGAELFPWLPVRWLATMRYDTLGKLPQVRVPVLILHGRADTLVPFHHAERNRAAANDPKVLWEIAGDHNDGPNADLPRFLEGWQRFLRSLASEGTQAP